MELFAILVPVLFVIAIIVRLAAGAMDGERVKEYIRGQGGEMLESHWHPFGRGWFGEENARIYEVKYRDRQGNIHKATVKTSMFSGVYFTEDRIVEKTEAPRSETQQLEMENERLRQRIAELESGDPDL